MNKVKQFVVAATMSAGLLVQAAIIPTTVLRPALATSPPAAAAAQNAAPAPAQNPAPAPAPVPKSNGKVVFIDPGHGASDSGAVHQDANGKADITEKDANLGIALKLADLLRQQGYDVRMARADDSTPVPGGSSSADLQARVDKANESGADLFVSIHNNAAANPAVKGTAIYYCADRSFSADSLRLAKAVNKAVVSNLAQAGYTTQDNGVKDECATGHFAVLAADNLARGTKMPGILGESLYLSNDQDAAQLKKADVQAAIAQGYFDGIEAYFGNGQS